MITAIIIDDELRSRQVLAGFLQEYCPDVQVLGEAISFKSGLALIQQTQPDIIFLDYELHDGTGFDVLASLPNLKSKIIFVSGHSERAIESYRFDVLDFLKKPLSIRELRESIEKYKRSAAKEQRIVALEKASSPTSGHLLAQQGDGIELVPFAEITRFEGKGSYTIVHLTNKREMTLTKRLSEIEAQLVGQKFVRVHRSHIVHLPFVKKILNNSRIGVEMRDESIVPATIDLLEEMKRLYPSVDWPEL